MTTTFLEDVDTALKSFTSDEALDQTVRSILAQHTTSETLTSLDSAVLPQGKVGNQIGRAHV